MIKHFVDLFNSEEWAIPLSKVFTKMSIINVLSTGNFILNVRGYKKESLTPPIAKQLSTAPHFLICVFPFKAHHYRNFIQALNSVFSDFYCRKSTLCR